MMNKNNYFIDDVEDLKEILSEIDDINAPVNKNLATLLHLCCIMSCDTTPIEYLLEKGANPHIKDKFGLTAFDNVCNIYKKFNIHGASHFGKHPIPTSIRLQLPFWLIVFHCFTLKNSSSNCFSLLSVSKLVNSGVNICLVQRLANHRNISTTQRYFNYNPQMLSNAVESLKI